MEIVYSDINNNNSKTGFTNNFLEERHADKLFTERYPDFPLYDEKRKNMNVYSTDTNDTYRDILKTIQERSPLSDLFFSKLNINHIKYLICKLVYTRSNNLYKIDPESQSDNEILTIMRAYYLQNAKHISTGIEEQVGELNLKVLLDIVPRVISKIQQELSYQRDHGSMPLPLEVPKCVSNAGTKSNRSVTDLFV